ATATWQRDMVNATEALGADIAAGECSDNQLAQTLSFQSALQALLNWLEMSVLLGFDSDVDKLRADPEAYVDDVVFRDAPVELGRLEPGLRVVVKRAAERLARRIDPQVVRQV